MSVRKGREKVGERVACDRVAKTPCPTVGHTPHRTHERQADKRGRVAKGDGVYAPDQGMAQSEQQR